MTFQGCLDYLLILGMDDWIQASEVGSVSREVGGVQTNKDCRELSLKLVRTLLETDLAEVGMISEQGTFLPWRLGVDAAMQRIERDWAADSVGPGLGEVCWLNLTGKGQTRAKELWLRNARERGEPHGQSFLNCLHIGRGNPLGNGVMFMAEVPGKVPGSKALYQKTADSNGVMTRFTKATLDPQGNIVYIKHRLP